jgi:hypothetical protein
MIYNINQPAEFMSDAEAMACLNQTRRDIGDDELLSIVSQLWNVNEVSIDADNCDIWIANPVSGRYLQPEEQRDLIGFIRSL